MKKIWAIIWTGDHSLSADRPVPASCTGGKRCKWANLSPTSTTRTTAEHNAYGNIESPSRS